ncbi:5'-nucleotidase C-terminal domain-containing protein [Paenibacillus eucommiae]|uniref:2',3'-cyclic-nucleotide 2'-phosphodiesterase (5'-nucleotidase family) n=1 Tax=Paenibacillus eucommiae TaxID=1355755 RepID=A0ABS4J9A4_9BACL|nr:5'-nucleotidase C-terminal domain-containing protein [Paenibacillus eucommiae]MBP1996375.1 2',3'-cyclic-nucleotide 2'-phosphodiesterase (5'-nucleotidase family) [Paenibacillus eucommiae]
MRRWRMKLARALAALALLGQLSGGAASAETAAPQSTGFGSGERQVQELDSISTGADSDKITIVHVNDMHARAEETADNIGYAKLATLIKQIKAENPNTLVLDAGDTFHGQTIANLVSGESIVSFMNEIGFDAMTTGNHDYNYGSTRLQELAGMANFPVLAANVYKADGTRLLKPYVIENVGGLKVAVFGLATPETLYKTHPKNVEGLTFADPVAEAKKMVDELSGQADIILALSHLGLDASSKDTSLKVAQQVKGIDVMIDGHSHTVLESGLTSGTTLIAQTGEYGKNVGVVELTIANKQVTEKKAHLITRAEAENMTADPAVLELITTVKASQEDVLSKVIGMTQFNLSGEREKVRVSETNLGNLITDAMLNETGADVAITNGGGIRASIPAGEITKGDVISVLPFGNYIQTKQVTGADLKAALEHGVGSYPESLGAFPHVAGIRFKFDANQPAGQRVHTVLIKGQALDLNRTYVLATNDFMAAGGDEYVMFKSQPIMNDFSSLEEAVIDYIQEKMEMTSGVEGRIVVEALVDGSKEPIKPEQAEKKYIVKYGDTLSAIARNYHTTWQLLQKLNHIRNANLIYPGQHIALP